MKRSIPLLVLGTALAASGCDASHPSDRVSTEAPSPPGSAAAASAALDAALGETDPYVRVQRLAELLPTLGPEAVPDVKRRLQRTRLKPAGAELELLVRYWASQDPAAATRWAVRLSAGPSYKATAVATAVEIWAQADPEAALTGVGAASQSFVREVGEAAQQALVRGWFQTDRGSLEEYIQGLGSGVQRQRAILAYALALTEAKGGDALMAWADAVPADDVRYKRDVVRQVTWALAWSDPEAAERWCDAQCEGPYGRGMRTAIVRARVNTGDGASAMEWMARAPEGERNDTTLQSGYAIWAMRDREAAFSWMRQKIAEGPEPWVRKLFGAYAQQLAATSPAEAVEWAQRFEGPEATREELLVRIARRWLQQDRAAAEAWLSQSPLSDEARARARNLGAPDYLPKVSPEGPEPPDSPEASAPHGKGHTTSSPTA